MVDTNGNPRCLDHHHQAEVANPSGSGGGSLSLSPNSLPNFEMITSTSPASSDAVSPMSSTSLPFGLPPTSTHNSESSDPNGNHLNAQARQSLPHPLPPPAPSSVVSTSSTNLTLPEILEGITKSDHFPSVRHRWNTNEEIAALLIALERHDDWLLGEVKIRPKSGSMMLYSRKRVRYRRDGYCWKKRKDGKTTREDHMKLKVQGIECIYGCYVHSAILPTFHRRCYWLLQNPDIVLVHYLNVPYNDDNKLISPSLSFFADTRKEWTREELIAELKPMFLSEGTDDHLPSSSQCESTTLATIESIVHQLMMRQRNKLARSAEADGSTPTTTTNANERKIATLTTVPALATNSQIINGSNPRTGKASGNGNSSTAKRDVHSGRNTTMTSSIQEDNAASSNSTVDVNGNVMQLAKSVTQHPPPQQTQTLQLLQLTSPQMCQLNATVTPASVTHSTDAPTHSLILSLSQLQAATGAGGQSFFILQQNSTTNHHHQVVPGTAATVSSTGNGTTAGTQTTPLTFIYGRPAETPKLQLSTVTSSATSSGQTFLTSHSQMTSQSENNNNRHLGGFRASQGVVHVKSEPEEEANDIEMTHAPASSRRFDLEDEKMICSEPSSPERYFTGNPLGPTDPSTSYGHLDADSISGLSTKDEPSSFDAFDSLFGNDSNLMNADPNFGSHYGSQADHSAMNTTTSDHHRQPSIVVHHRQSTATLNSTLHHSPDPIDSFMEATTEDDPTTADDILFSLDTFDIFGDFGNDPATDPGSTIHDLGDGTHTNNPNSSDTYSNGHSSSSGYHQTESGLAFPAAAANGQTASSQLGTGETAAATGNASGNKTRLGLLPMAAPDSCPIESTRSCGNNNQSGGNGPLVQQAVTVTMDENGNLQLVKAEKSTVQASSSLTTTRRAASAGHQGRHHQAANLHEITHKCSDSTLNDITDNEEFGLFTSQHQHQPQQQHQFSTPTSHAQNIRRQRHLSDMHTYHHQQQRPAETVHRPASRASSGRLSGGGGGNGASASSSDPNGNDPSLATIADYSPEWCYPEGGIKVLVAGPWYASQTTQYSIQFDGLTVPTELVQTGLLRCFSPKHDPGFVSLAVAANHVIISNSVIFEYRSHAEALSSAQTTPDYFAFDESLFRTTLLERCDKLNRGGVDGEDSGELLKQFLMDTNQNFEEALINFFETILDSASEITPPPNDPTTAHSHLTLLHLATALNLRALVSLLVTSYRKVKVQDLKNSWLLDQLNPTATDQHGSTPLAWAVALGHTELLELLLSEDEEAENNVKNIPDSEFESIDQPVSEADGSSQQMTSEETRSTSLVDDLHFVSTLELDSAVNQFDLQSLDDLIHYLEEHERACTTDEHTPPSGHSSLASSLDDASPGTPTLLLDTYREVIRSPSNSSPSTSSEYSLESLESLESLPLNSLPTSGGASSIDLAEYFRNTTSELQALKLTSSTNSPEMATFEAAGTIQKAYRKYRGRRRTETAALTIQHYYRRYKQGTAYFRNQLTAKGARKCLPPEEHQHHHSDAKRFKTSSPSASACIETDDDTDESGMYTGTNSSDISMTNSTAQSDEEEEEGKGRVCQGLAFEEMSLKMAIHSGRSTTQNRIISP